MWGLNPYYQLLLEQRRNRYAAPPDLSASQFVRPEARSRFNISGADSAGLGALAGGLLNSYMNRGEGIGDAFAMQQAARQSVLDRQLEEQRYAEQQAYRREQDERQRLRDEAYISNLTRDDERAAAQATAKVEQEAAESRRKEAERQAEIERRRELVAQVKRRDPALAAQLEPLVESDKFPYGEAVAASRTEDPRAAAREERAAAAAERAARAEERSTDNYERNRREDAERDVARRANEIFSDWLYSQPNWKPPTEEQRRAKRAEARAEAERELRGSPDAFDVDPEPAPLPTTTQPRPRATGIGASAEANTGGIAEDPGYTPAVKAAAARLGYDVEAARRAGVTWVQIRQVLGLM